jgi:hypothetical protein
VEKSSVVMEKYRDWVRRSGAIILDYSITKVKSYAPGIEHLEIILQLKKISSS